MAIPVGVQWYITVALIYISLMSNDVKHLFYVLIDHPSIFFTQMSSNTLPILKLGFVFFLLSCKGSLMF